MLQQFLALIVPLMLWGAVSGVLNLMLTRKSQIEAWVNANPRLAAWSKLLRSIGFDPWALHAWATLLVKKKLPEAQQADSDIAKIEQAKAEEKAARKGPPDDPGTTISIMPDPVKMVAQDRSRLHNDIPDDPAECRKWRHPDWRLQLVFGTLLACLLSCSRMADPCSEVTLTTIQVGCEARIAQECNGEKTCPAYVECSKAIKTWRACTP